MSASLPCPDPHESASCPSLCAAVIQKVLMKSTGVFGMEWADQVYWLVREIPPEQTQLHLLHCGKNLSIIQEKLPVHCATGC